MLLIERSVKRRKNSQKVNYKYTNILRITWNRYILFVYIINVRVYIYIYKRLRVYDSQMFTHVLQAYSTSEQSFDDSSRDKTLSLCNEAKITKISNLAYELV